MARENEIALGLRVRTGRTSAVALGGPLAAPRVLAHEELCLHDPRRPESFQPYHAALELGESEARAVVHRATCTARAATALALSAFLERLPSAPRRAAIVVSSETEPGSIANPHMRAHAEEGRLFPALVEERLREAKIAVRRVLESELEARALETLELGRDQVKRELARMGKEAGPPWRALEKSAALAAWIVLAGKR